MGQKTMAPFSTRVGADWIANTTSGGANLTRWGAAVNQGLTKHGALVLQRMGEFYAPEFQSLGV